LVWITIDARGAISADRDRRVCRGRFGIDVPPGLLAIPDEVIE
jgi:hypothetical protein